MSYSKQLTKHDVRTGYLLFPGREPESEEVIDRHIRQARMLSGLHERLIERKEFQLNIFWPLCCIFVSDAPIACVELIETHGLQKILDSALSSLRPGRIAAFQLLTSKRNCKFEILYYFDDMDLIDNQELYAPPQAYIFSLLEKYNNFAS